MGITGSTSPPQQASADTRNHAAQGVAQTGPACFEPDTGLLLQNPPSGISDVEQPSTLPGDPSPSYGQDTHQNRGTEESTPPSRHEGFDTRDHAAEWGIQTGPACFEPDTALLLQNPLDQDTYDPDQALSRPIGQMKCGGTILAERRGVGGQGSLLAKITCVMSFKITQDEGRVHF